MLSGLKFGTSKPASAPPAPAEAPEDEAAAAAPAAAGPVYGLDVRAASTGVDTAGAASTWGDGGASWAGKILRNAEAEAQRTGRSVRDIVGERHGDYDELRAKARTAAHPLAHSREAARRKRVAVPRAADDGPALPRGVRLGRDATDKDLVGRFQTKMSAAMSGAGVGRTRGAAEDADADALERALADSGASGAEVDALRAATRGAQEESAADGGDGDGGDGAADTDAMLAFAGGASDGDDAEAAAEAARQRRRERWRTREAAPAPAPKKARHSEADRGGRPREAGRGDGGGRRQDGRGDQRDSRRDGQRDDSRRDDRRDTRRDGDRRDTQRDDRDRRPSDDRRDARRRDDRQRDDDRHRDRARPPAPAPAPAPPPAPAPAPPPAPTAASANHAAAQAMRAAQAAVPAGASNQDAAAALRARLLGTAPPAAASAAAAAAAAPHVAQPYDRHGRRIDMGRADAPLEREDARESVRRRGKLRGARGEAALNGDGATLDDLVREERNGGQDMDANFARNVLRLGQNFKGSELGAGAGRGGATGVDEEDRVDAAMFNAPDARLTERARAERKRSKAVAEERKFASTVATHRQCPESDRFDTSMLLCMGEHAYVQLVARDALSDGHCRICPRQHANNSVAVDEECHEEMEKFKAAIRRMLRAARQSGVLFVEAATSTRGTPWAQVEAVPVPKEAEADAPLYFKQALEGEGSEWATHRKIIDTSRKGLRRCVPPQFAYFHVEHARGGMAQIVEDEAEFPKDLAAGVICGMLGRAPPQLGGSGVPLKDGRGDAARWQRDWAKFDFTSKAGGVVGE